MNWKNFAGWKQTDGATDLPTVEQVRTAYEKMSAERERAQRLHNTLVSALLAYDERESKKKHYNRYAFGQYLIRLEEIEQDIARGTPVRDAIVAGYTGRLLVKLLKAAGLPEATTEECRGTGKPLCYTPVSEL